MTKIRSKGQVGVQGIVSACIVGSTGGLTMEAGTPHDRLKPSQAKPSQAKPSQAKPSQAKPSASSCNRLEGPASRSDSSASAGRNPASRRPASSSDNNSSTARTAAGIRHTGRGLRRGLLAALALLVVGMSLPAEDALAQEFIPNQPAPPNLVISQRNHVVDEPAACSADEELQFRYDPGPPQTWGYFPGRHLKTVQYTVKLAAAPPAGKAVQVMVWDFADIDDAGRGSQTRNRFLEILKRHGHKEPVRTNSIYGNSVKVVKSMRGRVEVENPNRFGDTTQKAWFSWLNFTRSNWNQAQTVRVKVYCDAHDHTVQLPIYNVAVTYDRGNLPRNDYGLNTPRVLSETLRESRLWNLNGTSVDIVNFSIRDATAPQLQLDGQDAQDTVGTAVCDTASLKSAVQGYAAETHHGTAHVTRWKKVLAAFGDGNGYTTMTAAEAQTYADRGWSRWDPVVEALQCLENAGSDEPEPDIPGIAVTGGNGIVEGGDAVFTVHAEWAPSSDLAVTVKVDDDETSDFVAPGNEGTQTVVILAGQASATLTVATENDGTDEPDGSVSVTVEAGSGYMLGSPETAAVAVADDDGPPVATPVVRIAGGSGIAEGGTASFTLTATPAPAGVLTVTVDVTDSGQFATSGQTGTQTVTLGTTGTATLTVATADDDADEADGRIAATVRAGAGYTVAAAPDDTAAVAVADNDDPVVRLAAGNGVTEGAPATFTLTATPAPHADLTVSLAVTQSGDFAAEGQTGTREVVIPTEGSVTLEVATVNDSADEPNGSVSATLAAGTGYTVAASPDDTATVAVADDDAAAAGVPSLSVNDVEVQEGPYRRVTFTVTLSQASRRGATFYWQVQESTPVSAKRNKDFVAATRKVWASIRPGETATTIRAALVLDDSHDEDPETFEIVLSDATDATIADGVGVATIVNSDPMPQAWLGRLGRTLAQQALDGITGRLTAPRTPGAQGTLAGQAFSLRPGGTETPTADPTTPAPSTVERLAALVLPGLAAGGAGGSGAAPAFGGADPWFGSGDGDAGGRGGGLVSPSLNLRDVLLGSSFTATGQPDALGGSVALWGRAALATFDGQEDTFALDGEVLTGLLGVDYARDRWLLGVSLLQSASTGGYLDRNTGATPCPAHDLSAEMRALVCDGAVRAGDGKVEATLTAAVPYAAFQASERLHLWGAAGYGAGEVTLTPETGDALKTDLDWTMAQLGVRGTVLAPVANDDSGLAGGPALAVTSDALWARTTSEKVQDGLAASESDVTRLRLGLEGSWLMALEDLGQVTPKLAVGARHDGGDAETGFGVELGGGLAWNMPTAGLALNVEGRTLLTHREEAFQDQGLAASLVFDPDPATPRGPSVTLRQDWGGQATGGVEALFASNPLAQRQSTTATRRWAADLAWGFPAWDGAFTSSPLVGLGLAPGSRDYRLGWRLVPATAASAFALEVQATRREPDEAVPEHRLGLELSTRW